MTRYGELFAFISMVTLPESLGDILLSENALKLYLMSLLLLLLINEPEAGSLSA